MQPDRRLGATAILFVSFIWLTTTSGPSIGSEHCGQPVARLVSVFGTVEHRPVGKGVWRRAELEAAICPEDLVRTGAQSRAAVMFLDTETVLRIDQNTTLRVRTPKQAGRTLLDLLRGAAQFFSRTPRALEVDTPFVNAAIEGTEFFIAVGADQTLLTVFEGRVAARNRLGELIATGGQSLIASKGAAPRSRTVVRPRDAVQWALYYPPVLFGANVAGVTEAVREAAELLAAGRVAEAAARLQAAGDFAPALALRAVIAVAQNKKATALELGRAAVSANPNSVAARIALSYALQASFDLKAARDLLREGVSRRPDNALAWARLAELNLSLGASDDAVQAAARAAEISPDVSRMNTVLGFAALVRISIEEAKAAFGRAIRLDSQDPLPRLGLGLAKIRGGDLVDGRREIEIAVALDPGNSLIRSYLGKAYFEEGGDVLSTGYFRDFFAARRAEQAATQFSIAKLLDPNDPTPWFYDAILKQTRNNPVDALDDLKRSISLNDNRAVYRSRLQLDQDNAARSASLARIYEDLGYQQLGINEASKSLNSEPGNAAAHRFLSDMYRGVRRREIARVSELLQAQLLQDINVNPLQPSLSETNLNIVSRGGPTEAGFNEFTPLFERNRAQFNATGQVGNHDTTAGEGVLSAVYGPVSLSFGAYKYDTEGFRANNGLKHDIYSAFGQVAITPKLNVQAEFRRRDTDSGDLAINFDPDQFLDRSQRNLRQKNARFGLRYSPAPNSDFLVSFIHSDRRENVSETQSVPVPPLGLLDQVSNAMADEAGYQVEAQYLYKRANFNAIAGFAYGDVDSDLSLDVTLGGVPLFSVVTQSDIQHPRGYVYANVNLPKSVTWTVGVGFDDYEENGFEVEEVNPKFGMQWNITDDVRLRGAVFQTVKPALVSNRTIEPTLIAGFNQFFDDTNATKSLRYGVGVDWDVAKELSVGVEASWRDLDEPVLQGTTFITEDRNEQLHRIFAYWTPISKLALRSELTYDLYETDASVDNDLPRRMESISALVGVRYFHRSGFFAEFATTYVDQDVKRSPLSSLVAGSDNFIVVDAAVGWRLPNRLGLVSLQVRNLFDNTFRYQDDSFREFSDEASIGPYIPDRTILGRVSLKL